MASDEERPGVEGLFALRTMFSKQPSFRLERSDLAFHISHIHGASESDPSLESFDALYDELKQSNTEHTDVSVTHDSGWCLGAFQSGLLVWENVEDGDPRHMRGVDREQTLRLWRLLANGNIDEIDQENWLDGYN